MTTLINCRGKLIDLSIPKVMAIINVTPDSFFDGGSYSDAKALQMVEDGASILDIGGQSTRPGATMISAEEEWSRVEPVLKNLRRNNDVLISIDTFYSEVARRAVAEGADIINDISGGLRLAKGGLRPADGGMIDNKMFDTVAQLKVPYVLMHIKGTPATMQQNPHYDNLVNEVIDYFVEKTQDLRTCGITDIILDPGFGFGKTAEHNFELLNKLDIFKTMFGLPILVGLSRKSFTNKSLNGTTALNTVALMKGASILRVHDVKEAVETVRLFEKIG